MPRSPVYGLRGVSPGIGVLARRPAAPVAGGGFGAILAANCSPGKAWWAETLPASGSTGDWTDYIAGVVATATGDPQVGTLNGKRAAVLTQTVAQRYTTGTFTAIPQPFAVVTAVNPADSGAGIKPFSGATEVRLEVPNSAALRRLSMRANTPELISANDVIIYEQAHIVGAVYNGAASSIRVNGVVVGSGATGTESLTTVVIGARGAGLNVFIGSGALFAIIAPNAAITDPTAKLNDVIARAAAVEAGALTEYSIV